MVKRKFGGIRIMTTKIQDILRQKAIKKKNELEKKYSNLKREFNRLVDDLNCANEKLSRVQDILKSRGILINLEDLLGED